MTPIEEFKQMTRAEKLAKCKELGQKFAGNVIAGVAIAVTVHTLSKPINNKVDDLFDKEIEASTEE